MSEGKRFIGTCFSRGPRIGEDGMPYCKLPIGHKGLHEPAPEDGWGEHLNWGQPAMIDYALRRQERDEHRAT